MINTLMSIKKDYKMTFSNFTLYNHAVTRGKYRGKNIAPLVNDIYITKPV